MTAPAGWYPDFQDAAIQRYWDGSTWTSHTAARTLSPHDGALRPEEQQKQAKHAEKQAAKAQRVEARRQQKLQDEARKRQQELLQGRQLACENFGGKTIQIFENGFIQVGGLFGGGASELLISIEASSDVAKKSGLGRGAAAVVTGGVNLMGSNKRGDVYLTISTESNIYALRETPPTAGNMTRSKKLEATGTALIHRLSASQALGVDVQTAMPRPTPDGIQSRLVSLQSLLDSGLISEHEYGQKRSEILRQI